MARKTLVTVNIPQDLKEFLHEVSSQIAEGDEATLVESDDLLQSKSAYGGLIEEGSKQFGFTYFVDDHATWEILLDESQISEIGSGNKSDLKLWQCSSDKCNCLYPSEDYYCRHCDSIRNFDVDFQSQLLRFHADEPPHLIESLAKLRRIVIAILDYHADNSHLPPPFTAAPDGLRLHSWRTLVLPYLDRNDLYEQINFNLPWNHPDNARIASQIPDEFASQGIPFGHTRICGIIGDDTLWPEAGARHIMDVRSGISYTIAVVESPVKSIHWMEPIDLSVNELVNEVGNPKLLAGFADGHVDVIRNLNRENLQKLVAI